MNAPRPGPSLRVHVHADDPARLVPGEDLLLEPPPEHVIAAPRGALLDDLLTREDRQALDREALERLAAWRARHDAALTVDGACLPWIWETELLAEVFLPEVRTVAGLELMLERHGVDAVEVRGADAEAVAALQAVARRAGRSATAGGEVRPLPVYPGRRAAPWRGSRWSRARHALVSPWGVPPLVRGDVLFVPYWHVLGLHRRLLREPGLVPVHDPFKIPPGPLRSRAAAVAAGGWTARPNRVQKRLSQRRLAGALAALAPVAATGDPLDALLDRRARRLLEHVASDTPALVRSLRRAMTRRGGVRAALLSFDSPADMRTILAACRSTGRPSLVVQHGFWAEPNDPDKSEADVAAVWSERDREILAARRAGPIVVTGNPGVEGRRRGVVGDRGRTLILPEYPSRVSLAVDARVNERLIHGALEALSAARPGSVALIRPHPADHDLDVYEEMGATYPQLRVEIDSSSPIGEVIARCDLCVSGVSTATLEAALDGVPAIFFNAARVDRPWPFDGAPDALPREIPAALERRGRPVPDAIADALGVRPGAEDRVVAVLRELVDGADG